MFKKSVDELVGSPAGIEGVRNFSDTDSDTDWEEVMCGNDGKESDEEYTPEVIVFNNDNSLLGNVVPNYTDKRFDESQNEEDNDNKKDCDAQKNKEMNIRKIPFDILSIILFSLFMYYPVSYYLSWLIIFLTGFCKLTIFIIFSLYLYFSYCLTPSLFSEVKNISECILELEIIETMLKNAGESCKNKHVENQSDVWNEYSELIYGTCLHYVVCFKSCLEWIRTYENIKNRVESFFPSTTADSQKEN